jgi:simple sugar transport system permease protein
MIFGAAIAGGVWGLIPAYLRAKHGVHEIIVTLLMVFIAQELAGYFVRGPMQGSSNFPATDVLPLSAQFTGIYGNLHFGFIIMVVLTFLVWIMVKKSVLGYEITVLGSNPDAGDQMGMRKFWMYIMVLTLGGAIAGLAGAIEIMGVQQRLTASFSPGYGFTGIPIALLGRNGAWQVLLAGVFFALLYVGGASMEVAFGVPAALVDVIQALVILFLITAEFLKQYKVSIRYNKVKAADVAAQEEV